MKLSNLIRAAAMMAVLLLAIVCVAGSTGGCRVQAVDRMTGDKVGGPVSALEAPAVNPATGNPTELQKTDELDEKAVQTTVNVVSSYLPPPFNYLVPVAAAAALGAYAGDRRRRAGQKSPAPFESPGQK